MAVRAGIGNFCFRLSSDEVWILTTVYYDQFAVYPGHPPHLASLPTYRVPTRGSQLSSLQLSGSASFRELIENLVTIIRNGTYTISQCKGHLMSPVITSVSNTKIKLVRALQSRSRTRQSEGAFVAEGVRLLEEAFSVNWTTRFILYDESLSERGRILLDTMQNLPNLEISEIDPKLMAEISDTETPQGILAVLERGFLLPPPSPSFIMIADQVRDPGNLGTLLRTAEAVGVEVVYLTPGTADAFSPKVLRAGMGAHFHLPILEHLWDEIQTLLQGLPIFLAESTGGLPIWDADFRQSCALLVGGEAFGASPQGEQAATHRVTIPMSGRAESLNAAVAGGILMAEVLRQRQTQRKE